MSASVIHFLNKDLLRKQEFISNGTFNVPDKVDRVFVWGCGGGGGGGGAAPGDGFISNGGGAGGGGAGGQLTLIEVTPLSAIPITIGTGGTGGLASTSGTNGGDSSFGSTVFPGAKGGWGQVAGLFTIGERIGKVGGMGTYIGGVSDSFGSVSTGSGQNSANYKGGNPGGVGFPFGGGGAGGEFGAGGNGGISGGVGGSAGANTGAGGGGGGSSSTVGGAGGNGGSGRIIVYWIETE